MKKILFIVLMGALFSCKKESEPTGLADVKFQARPYKTKTQSYSCLDSIKFEVFIKHSDATPIAVAYGDYCGNVSFPLEYQKEYYIKVNKGAYSYGSYFYSTQKKKDGYYSGPFIINLYAN